MTRSRWFALLMLLALIVLVVWCGQGGHHP
jgi:hypothetical protein